MKQDDRKEPQPSSAIRVKRRAYSSVPDDILTDRRLSWRARIVLSWMLGRSPEFELRIGPIRRLFGLSEQQWSKVRWELQNTGYFQQERVQGEHGKFVWFHVVTDTPEIPSPTKPGDGSPQAGGPEGGKPSHGGTGDIPTRRSTNYERTKKINTTTTDTANSNTNRESLIWPRLSEPEKNAIADLLAGIPQKRAQELLDELASALEAQSIRTSPSRWFRAVVSRCKKGEFNPAGALAIAAKRNASTTSGSAKPIKAVPSSPHRAQCHMQEIKALLGIRGSSSTDRGESVSTVFPPQQKEWQP